jgi:hypothetical protein
MRLYCETCKAGCLLQNGLNTRFQKVMQYSRKSERSYYDKILFIQGELKVKSKAIPVAGHGGS